MLIAFRILFIVVVVYLFLISPNVIRPKRDFSMLTKHRYAHRGLFGGSVPENSLTAFQKAVENGYGIELDVHLTKDGQLVVFHDDDLSRVCGIKGKIEEKTLAELSLLRLNGTEEKIPTLDETLDVVDGRIPLIIEMKGLSTDTTLAVKLDERLKTYRGVYCVESFNPFLIGWYRRKRPDIVRGQLSGDLHVEKNATFANKALFFMLRNLLCNVVSRPDFIAYEYTADKNFSCRVLRLLFSPLWAAWTVNAQTDFDALKNRYAILIFEGFVPNEKQV